MARRAAFRVRRVLLDVRFLRIVFMTVGSRRIVAYQDKQRDPAQNSPQSVTAAAAQCLGSFIVPILSALITAASPNLNLGVTRAKRVSLRG